jgi:lipopolysaccharide biosynthesis protein
LRLPEARQAQADLAREYGIHGFCYYHYWFNGKRLLERPFNDVLASGKPDFPFCLCWANENWTKRWDGQDQEILAEQVYGEESDRLHMQWLAQAFQDPRYIRVEGKPLFLVYRAMNIPDPKKTSQIWR